MENRSVEENDVSILRAFWEYVDKSFHHVHHQGRPTESFGANDVFELFKSNLKNPEWDATLKNRVQIGSNTLLEFDTYDDDDDPLYLFDILVSLPSGLILRLPMYVNATVNDTPWMVTGLQMFILMSDGGDELVADIDGYHEGELPKFLRVDMPCRANCDMAFTRSDSVFYTRVAETVVHLHGVFLAAFPERSSGYLHRGVSLREDPCCRRDEAVKNAVLPLLAPHGVEYY